MGKQCRQMVSRELSSEKEKKKRKTGEQAFYYNPKMQKKRLRRKYSLERKHHSSYANRRKYQSFLSCCADSRQLKVQLHLYQEYLQESWVGTSLLPSYLYISHSFKNVLQNSRMIVWYVWQMVRGTQRKGRFYIDHR